MVTQRWSRFERDLETASVHRRAPLPTNGLPLLVGELELPLDTRRPAARYLRHDRLRGVGRYVDRWKDLLRFAFAQLSERPAHRRFARRVISHCREQRDSRAVACDAPLCPRLIDVLGDNPNAVSEHAQRAGALWARVPSGRDASPPPTTSRSGHARSPYPRARAPAHLTAEAAAQRTAGSHGTACPPHRSSAASRARSRRSEHHR